MWTLQRRIIDEEFYEAAGISKAVFYKLVKIIRDSNNLKPRNQPRYI